MKVYSLPFKSTLKNRVSSWNFVGHVQNDNSLFKFDWSLDSPKYLIGETIVFLKLDLSLTFPISPIFL